MTYLMSRKEAAILAQYSKCTLEEMIEHLKTQDIKVYDELWKPTNEMQKITDRINRRLNGEYVTPAWVEALRNK